MQLTNPLSLTSTLAHATETRFPSNSAICSLNKYENRPLVLRIARELSLDQSDAEKLFSDTKLFLWLCSFGEVLSPPPLIDEAWHVFIIFTEDYADFCNRHFGRFIHHRPSRPDDVPDNGASIRKTVKAATKRFGSWSELSKNWEYPGISNPLLHDTCSSDSVSCNPTPSCNGNLDALAHSVEVHS